MNNSWKVHGVRAHSRFRKRELSPAVRNESAARACSLKGTTLLLIREAYFRILSSNTRSRWNFTIRYEDRVHERCDAAKESFWFHRTNDIVKHGIILTVHQRFYHDNIADDIIRIMFASRRRSRKVDSSVAGEEDQAGGKRVNFTRRRQKFRWTFKAFNIKRQDRSERARKRERKANCPGGRSELVQEKLYQESLQPEGNFHIIIRYLNYSNKGGWLSRISGHLPLGSFFVLLRAKPRTEGTPRDFFPLWNIFSWLLLYFDVFSA